MKIKLAQILKITALAEQALVAFMGNDLKTLKGKLQAARDAIDAVIASL